MVVEAVENGVKGRGAEKDKGRERGRGEVREKRWRREKIHGKEEVVVVERGMARWWVMEAMEVERRGEKVRKWKCEMK